jgi:hypothetical protein
MEGMRSSVGGEIEEQIFGAKFGKRGRIKSSKSGPETLAQVVLRQRQMVA